MSLAAGLRAQMRAPFRGPAKCFVAPKAMLCAAPRVVPVTRVATSILVPRPHLLSSSSSSFVGGFSVNTSSPRPGRSRGSLVVVAGGKSMGCTLRGTRRHRRRTSGFRTRMMTAAGRNVIKRRRQRGRKNLCPASDRRSGGKK